VTGHLAGVEAGLGGVALQHERHRRRVETCRADMAMAIDRAEGMSFVDG
jgi:hypothetical protein